MFSGAGQWPLRTGGEIADASARHVFARLYRMGGDVGRQQDVVQLHEGMLRGLILVRENIEPLVGIQRRAGQWPLPQDPHQRIFIYQGTARRVD